MAEDEPQDQEGQEAEQYTRIKPEDLKALRASADKAKEYDNLQREMIMMKAGVNTETPAGKMFFKAYEGELNKEAVVAAAQEVGILDVATTPSVTEGEKGSTQERQQLAQGAATPDQNPTHPKKEALENAERIIKEGGTYEQGAAGFINTLVQRYADGDERAVRTSQDRYKR